MAGIKSFITREDEQNRIAPIIGKSGISYTFTNSITIGRYTIFENYQMAVSLGQTPKEMFNSMKKTHDLFNQNKFGDAIINNANNMHPLARISDKGYNPYFYLCTLFLNKEGEDLSTWDEAQAKAKIDDWTEYNADDFFLLAQHIAPDFSKESEEISQN